jgi:DGQHR domain-containing protein
MKKQAKRSHTPRLTYLRLLVLQGTVLGVPVYRGYAKLSDLARLSKADVFDQRDNPTGTQRDLSPKHARDAYEYVKTRDFAFWPEVFLCARRADVLSFRQIHDAPNNVGELSIRRDIAEDSDVIAISRVDGNHRLFYADGLSKGYPALEKEVSFCIAYGLTLEQEIILFRDINDNQRKMNTSHLENIQARLTKEEKLKRQDPALYIARRLGTDSGSPLFERVYEGGVRPPGWTIPLKTLKTGIQYMLSRPTKLTALGDTDAEYTVICNYLSGVRKWIPDSWEYPGKYLVLRGAGLWGICFIGAEVIDRVLAQGKFETRDMLAVLQSGQEWDWSNKGDFAGLSGRGGAVRISGMVTKEFQDESGVSIRALSQKIMRGRSK